MKPFPMLPFGSSTRAYGHTGTGGSFGYADPDRAVGYAYVTNRAGFSVLTDRRELALRRATWRRTAHGVGRRGADTLIARTPAIPTIRDGRVPRPPHSEIRHPPFTTR